jgi:hypothetical protein
VRLPSASLLLSRLCEFPCDLTNLVLPTYLREDSGYRFQSPPLWYVLLACSALAVLGLLIDAFRIKPEAPRQQ